MPSPMRRAPAGRAAADIRTLGLCLFESAGAKRCAESSTRWGHKGKGGREPVAAAKHRAPLEMRGGSSGPPERAVAPRAVGGAGPTVGGDAWLAQAGTRAHEARGAWSEVPCPFAVLSASGRLSGLWGPAGGITSACQSWATLLDASPEPLSACAATPGDQPAARSTDSGFTRSPWCAWSPQHQMVPIMTPYRARAVMSVALLRPIMADIIRLPAS